MKSLFCKALLLEYITLTWNVVGCFVIIIVALHSSSVSLLGFGIDSVIEIFASLIVIWQLKKVNKNKEAAAMKLIGIAFLMLAVYITIQSVIAVIHHKQPNPSSIGIIWLIITVIAMFLLAYEKKRVGTLTKNSIVIKEAGITMIDGLLALSVFICLLLTKYFQLWWTDVAGGIVLAVYALKEGMQAFKKL